ncbi:FAD:protein FMN transferase [Hymenobacter sp. BT186]|uniref:FAD:protein FMN transferase n=1 Tax=Hymenobacter telluris TaxID=2816474 RepID=A0A939EZD3_9BACT|nr:FAD:protein FMN transferase [Hymenobacter telluris]MBO0359942.1 FAD:protein FMN transferase [Hymenobacter telluris]MBW3375969.1 FAD:protein FMN transferase [Hymenobacter norwichensis]
MLWLLPVDKAPLRPFQLSGYAQGTTYTITYYAPDSLVTKAEVRRQLAEIDASLSLYQPNSLINRFNESATGVLADGHLRVVAGKALDVYRQTDGVFDATVQPLVQAWGFGTRPTETAPSAATIQAILPAIGSDKIQLRNDSLVKKVAAVHLDLNGIAQGYTVDVLAALLERKHIRNYLVELGGELRVRGRKQPGGHRMRIGIERPDSSGWQLPGMQQVIELEAGGITTSGNYRKFRQAGTTRTAHLIDPKSGYPLRNEMISVTVVAPDAITADAYDNALMGMGLPKSLAFLRAHPNLHAYIIYQRPNGAVADTASPGFHRLVSHP